MEILSEILLRIDSETVKSFKSTTYEIQYFIEEVEKDEEYWRRKLSRYLGFEVNDKVGKTWRKMYEKVIKYEKDPYEMIKLDYAEILAGLIVQGFDPADDKNHPVQVACLFGSTNVMKLLLEDSRVDPSADENYLIELASEKGRTEIVKMLLKHPKVNPGGGRAANEPIAIASENGNTEIVKLLLQDGRVNPADRDNRAIERAARYNHLDIVKLLLADSRVKESLSEEDYQKCYSMIN